MNKFKLGDLITDDLGPDNDDYMFSVVIDTSKYYCFCNHHYDNIEENFDETMWPPYDLDRLYLSILNE